MIVLVAGSEGSLSQMLIPEFQKLGHEVVGVDNFARYGAIDRLRSYEFVQADLTDTGQVRDLCQRFNPEVVIHTAALVYGVVGFHARPADIIVDNNLMTMNLLKFSAHNLRRFVYLSSSMVYERCQKLPHAETDADQSVVMSTSYGLSKYIGERVVKSFHEQYGMEYTIWRPFNIITPFEKPEEQGFSHVFADLIRKIIVDRQEPLQILGDGEQIRCFTSIFDVAEALAKFSFSDQAKNETFNIGNPEPVTIKRLAELIVEIAKADGLLPQSYTLRYEHLPVYDDDVRKRQPDISHIREVFGWQPQVTLRQSLVECIRIHKELMGATSH